MKLVAMLLLVLACSRVSAQMEQVTVWKSGDDGYHTYRIPSVLVSAKGTVLAFCEGRVAGGGDSGEINLLLKRSTDGGKTFGAQQVVWADGGNTCGNPCAVIDETTGTIWLLMTHNLGEDHEREIKLRASKGTRTVWVTSSTDDGLTWATPREITSDVKKPEWTWYATGPGVGIQLKRGPHKGRLVIPCDYVATPAVGDGNSHIIYSDDHGQTWKLGGEAPRKEFNESQVVELSDGRIMLNMRNHAAGDRKNVPRQRGVCISDDGGITFKELRRDDALVEPICQASIVRYTWPDNGERSRILFSNPASTTDRNGMTLRMSYDEGETWHVSKMIHPGPSAYSCLVALPEGSIGLLYEGGTKRYGQIDFARFTRDWLTDQKDPSPAPAGEDRKPG